MVFEDIGCLLGDEALRRMRLSDGDVSGSTLLVFYFKVSFWVVLLKGFFVFHVCMYFLYLKTIM